MANAIFPLQPVTALVYAQEPQAFPVTFVVNDLALGPVSGGAGAITAAIQDVLSRLANPVGARIAPSEFEAAISSVPGVGGFTLAYPLGPLGAPVGSIVTIGSVRFGAS